jgi:predicted MPP superfamily phosphohydrolase
LSFALLYAVLLASLIGASLYVHRRASSSMRLSPRWRGALALVLAACVVAIVLVRLLRASLPEPVTSSMGIAASTFSLSIIFSAMILLLGDSMLRAVALVNRLVNRFRAEKPAAALAAAPAAAVAEPAPPPAPAAPPSALPAASPVTRRVFLGQTAVGSAFLIGGSSSIYGALVGRHDYEVVTVPIPLSGLPRALDGFTIVQLSDLHLGLFAGEAEIAAAEDLVRKARPDLVVITGDLVDFDPHYAAHVGRLVRRLGPLAREGVVAVPGNHDYYAGVDKILDAAREGGCAILRNRGRVIGAKTAGFALLGVDDVWGQRVVPGAGPDLARALADVPPDLPRVLLCHNPVFFPSASRDIGLQLSGHTHGGQINAFVRPADWVLPYDYVAGLYERDGARLYVNRGFGTAGPPLRIGAPPEITRIVLVAA